MPIGYELAHNRSVRRSYPTYHIQTDEFADAARGPHGFVGHLGDANWLDGAFNASDLLMVAVLRRLNGSGIRAYTP
jgi:glutathione S-transferase